MQTDLPVKSPRLPPQQCEIINRSSVIAFCFDGKEYTGYQGDTIASALTAAGVQILSRSFKYHRPRGLLCCSGDCPNCLVQVDDEPNIRACTRKIIPGMDVRPQNAWPSLKYDFLSLTQLGSQLMQVGFYYKTFIKPSILWPLFERILRKSAGLGKIDPNTPPGEYDKQYLHADVTVIGGGPSGISAELSAAKQGARVIVFDSEPALGGHLRFNTNSVLRELTESLSQYENIDIFTDTTVQGIYEDNWLSASRGNRLFKIRSKSLVLATGAHEIPLVFENNDLPGVMLGSAVQRLPHLFGVNPGKQFLIVTANEDGWRLAGYLQSAGINVSAIVDERSQDVCNSLLLKELVADNTLAFYEHTILKAVGSRSVKNAQIVRIDSHGTIDPSTKRSLECDIIAMSVGWTPALGLLLHGRRKNGV